MRENDSNAKKPNLQRLAGHLDGKSGRLTGKEARIAREIDNDQRWLGAMLDVTTPPAVLERAFRHLDGAMADARRPRRFRLVGPLIAVGAVAAAVAVVALLGVLIGPPAEPGPVVQVDPAEAVAQFLADEPTAVDAELTVVDGELTVAWTDLVLEDEFGGMASTEAVDHLFEQFWLADPLDVYVETDDSSL